MPVTEEQKWSAYPGCYALSKVLEEVMLEQYYIQCKHLRICALARCLTCSICCSGGRAAVRPESKSCTSATLSRPAPRALRLTPLPATRA